MPTITLSNSLLRSIQEKKGATYDPEDWLERLSQIGCVVEGIEEESIEIEVFPDRTDLLSHETMARAARAFLDGESQEPTIATKDSGISLEVDSSLESVRPIIMAAIVKGVNNGDTEEEKDQFIQSLMDHQEKLHLSLGRKRKFSSIGVHDLSTLSPPFRVITVPETHSFIPLAMDEKMSIQTILNEHPKGVEYAHLTENLDSYPVILDSNDDILSFPPIINGAHTTVSESTTDFFIDVTGWDERAVETCLLLVCLALSERGGSIEQVKVTGFDGQIRMTPNMESKEHRLSDRLINRILGLTLESQDIASAIQRMGGNLVSSRAVTNGVNKAERWADLEVGEKEHVIAMPRWRTDIMHPVDIVEDIAIGYGYENMPNILSSVHLDAIPLPSAHLHRRVRESLRSLNLQETQSLTLSNERVQFDKTRWKSLAIITELANPITIDHTMMRQRILPSLLQLLAANRHHELPQRVYEIGTVVLDSNNATRAAWACAEVGGGFSAAKGFAQAFLRDIGANLDDVVWESTNLNEGPWLAGRGAKVFIFGEEIGQIGEIDPAVASEFGLRVPIQAGDFDIDALGRLIPDPVL
ncbi:MAG: phenylalanine--tRNA ligase subunit beta [Euryarchaeota archaeon]